MAEPKYYWEDITPGEVAQFGAYAVTSEEIIAFASEYDPQLMHIDEAAAKQTFIGGLCSSGWHTCAMTMRMICDHYLPATAFMGAPEVDDAKWRAPVRPGDILSVTRECLERHPSQSNPQTGLTRMRHTLKNQHGEVKMIMDSRMMFARRHAAVT